MAACREPTNRPRGGPRGGRAGFTFIEVLTASLVASVMAGGMLGAFVAAARLAGQRGAPQTAEVNLLAQETLERFRNQVAADSAFLRTAAGLSVDASGIPLWIADALPARATRGTESVLDVAEGARRCYRVVGEDCDGDGLRAGEPSDPSNPSSPPAVDCYAIQVTVCWNDLTGCPCPTS